MAGQGHSPAQPRQAEGSESCPGDTAMSVTRTSPGGRTGFWGATLCDGDIRVTLVGAVWKPPAWLELGAGSAMAGARAQDSQPSFACVQSREFSISKQMKFLHGDLCPHPPRRLTNVTVVPCSPWSCGQAGNCILPAQPGTASSEQNKQDPLDLPQGGQGLLAPSPPCPPCCQPLVLPPAPRQGLSCATGSLRMADDGQTDFWGYSAHTVSGGCRMGSIWSGWRGRSVCWRIRSGARGRSHSGDEEHGLEVSECSWDTCGHQPQGADSHCGQGCTHGCSSALPKAPGWVDPS